ncbi:heat shock cognate 70 kDa protein-like protein [Tanacetum coccineum]
MSKRVGETVVGIHFETTDACVAVWFDRHNRVVFIPNEQGNNITPTCVAWYGRELLVDEAAKDINTVYKEKKFTLEDICAEILRSLKEDAKTYLQTTINHVVITVPPTSAAIAYGLDNKDDIHSLKNKIVLIFNIGGQTFEVSLLSISADGIIIDKAKKEKKDVNKNAKAMMKLKVACENAKRDFSSTTISTIKVDSLYKGIDFSIKFTRANIEYLNQIFFYKCIEHVEICLKDGYVHKKGVDHENNIF